MLLDLLKTRYSCRSFSDRKIDPDIIDYMLQCGRLSSSGNNEQSWKFGVITDPELIGQIAEAASVNYSQAWIAKAPLLIALCTRLLPINEVVGANRFPSIRDQLLSMNGYLYSCVNMEEHQTKIPGEHMVLAALEHGVFSTWISSMDCEKVGQLLGAEGYVVSNVIAFGYPERRRAVTPKKALEEIVFMDRL